jgi:hypothetical protein
LSRKILTLAFSPLLLVAAPSMAQEHQHEASSCDAPGELPASLENWRDVAPLKAAGDRKSLRAARLTPGQAAKVSLLQTPKVAYPVRPAKPGGTVSYGGMLSFSVGEEGVWRVALGAAPWVDVVKDGVALPSVAHGHGPECTGIRKMVDYHLSPGTYTLQVAANGTDTVAVMVARQP